MAGSYPTQLQMELQPQLALQPRPGLGGRELYSKEQWEAQKTVIKQLYNHEKKPFKRVIDILRTEYNFFPTYATISSCFIGISPSKIQYAYHSP